LFFSSIQNNNFFYIIYKSIPTFAQKKKLSEKLSKALEDHFISFFSMAFYQMALGWFFEDIVYLTLPNE
jgi:hypothetical protein